MTAFCQSEGSEESTDSSAGDFCPARPAPVSPLPRRAGRKLA
jgi:hypothetical protein